MTSKERVLRTMNHELPDRIPISDEVWPSTSKRWHHEGYPWQSWVQREMEDGYFGFDLTMLEFNHGPIYTDDRVLEYRRREGEYVIKSTSYGGKYKVRDDGKAGALLIEWPVRRKADWEEIKQWIKPDHDRVDWNGIAREYRRACDKQLFKLLNVSWGWDVLQWYIRDEDLLMAMLDDPGGSAT